MKNENESEREGGHCPQLLSLVCLLYKEIIGNDWNISSVNVLDFVLDVLFPFAP